MNTAAVTTTYRQVPALAPFIALIERPLKGGADKVLRVSLDAAQLRDEARKLTVVGDTVAYACEECVPYVIRLRDEAKYMRGGSYLDGARRPLLVFTNYLEAAYRASGYCEDGLPVVVEMLDTYTAERYRLEVAA